MLRAQPYTGPADEVELLVALHCAGHTMRNEAPERVSGPSSVSGVSVHDATNAVATNCSEMEPAEGKVLVVV